MKRTVNVPRFSTGGPTAPLCWRPPEPGVQTLSAPSVDGHIWTRPDSVNGFLQFCFKPPKNRGNPPFPTILAAASRRSAPAVGIKPNLILAAVTRWHEFACAECCTLLAPAGAHSRDMALGKPDHRADRGLLLDAGRDSYSRSGRLRPVRDDPGRAQRPAVPQRPWVRQRPGPGPGDHSAQDPPRSEEHTSKLQSRENLV